MKAKQTLVALALGFTVSLPAFASETADKVSGFFGAAVDKVQNFVADAGIYAFEKAMDGAQFLLDSAVPSAHAAIDTTAVGTSLTAAQSSGEEVGELVIGVVAGLVVVGIIIGMVKKL